MLLRTCDIRTYKRNKANKILLPALLKTLLVCTAVVNALDNFQVGYLTAAPTAGTEVDTTSYGVCGTRAVSVDIGLVLDVTCADTSTQYRWVIIQSLDMNAEKLCLAEVCITSEGQCAINIVLMQQWH